MFLSNYYLYKGKIRLRIARAVSPERYARLFPYYGGKMIINANTANNLMAARIESGKPFLACRFGSTELSTISAFHFKCSERYQKVIDHVHFYSGFFPANIDLGSKFADIMINAASAADVLAVWFHPYEDYYVRRILSADSKICYLTSIEPWMGQHPWTRALKGKRVLVIHPFEESIQRQYTLRDKLFANKDILPDFDLRTLKAVQTIAGSSDERFSTWFEALNYMYIEAMRIGFDVAILGCGAYGMPLAAMFKNAGKQAIHLGGVTQILFGIKGRRWLDQPVHQPIRQLFNENWCFPSENERPTNSQAVEGNCYWQ